MEQQNQNKIVCGIQTGISNARSVNKPETVEIPNVINAWVINQSSYTQQKFLTLSQIAKELKTSRTALIEFLLENRIMLRNKGYELSDLLPQSFVVYVPRTFDSNGNPLKKKMQWSGTGKDYILNVWHAHQRRKYTNL